MRGVEVVRMRRVRKVRRAMDENEIWESAI